MCALNLGRTIGYERHRRRGEKPCGECKQARNDYSNGRRRAIKAGTWIEQDMPRYTSAPAVLLDHLDTFGSMTTPVLVLQLEDRFRESNVRRALYRLAARGQVTKREDWDGQPMWAVA
jgi:hypothetical protein